VAAFEAVARVEFAAVTVGTIVICLPIAGANDAGA
jgi:hypothetical protein